MWARNALSSCRRHPRGPFQPFSRSLATDASTSSTDASPKSSLPQTSYPKRPQQRLPITTAIILNRSPLITRTPSLFARAYYAYQARIQRALHNPFPYEFWFKEGSPLETRFRVEDMKRERKAFGKPFGMPATDAEGKVVGPTYEDIGLQEEDEESMPRAHAADMQGDIKSLDRKGQRNLYLLIKAKSGEEGKEVWKFPEGGLQKGELLHEAAARDLTAVCGPYMDTWIVSRKPIGVYNPSSSSSDDTKSFTFFCKAHILAGQVRIDKKHVLDFAWLTKQEIESRLETDYWLGVKDVLSDF